jgi:hypothetical protein
MDVLAWLRDLGLRQYEAAFRDNAIDGAVLLSLTSDDLKEMGVGPVAIAVAYSTPSRSCGAKRVRSQGQRPSTGANCA